MKAKLTIAVALALAGTSAAPAGQAQHATAAAAAGPAADANLFIYRNHAEPTVWAPTVKIDGRKVVAIGQKQYTALRVAPGEHKVTLAWPLISGQHGQRTSVTIAGDGQVHYLEVVGISRYAGGYGTMMAVRMGSGIGEVDAREGAAAVAACCKFKAPK